MCILKTQSKTIKTVTLVTKGVVGDHADAQHEAYRDFLNIVMPIFLSCEVLNKLDFFFLKTLWTNKQKDHN